MAAPKRTPEEEIKYLKEKLKVKIDLVNGQVTLITPDNGLSLSESTDISILTKYPEWKAFEGWYLKNIKMLYEESAKVGRDEAYIMSRLAKCLTDMLESAVRIKGEQEEPTTKDPYDQDSNDPHQALPVKPGDNLPLPTDD